MNPTTIPLTQGKVAIVDAVDYDRLTNWKEHHIGYFDSAEEAAHARDAKAIELHGEFARLNFP